MALRHFRNPGLGRIASSRAGFVALAAALYTVAALVATWPALKSADSHFLADKGQSFGQEATPGDHLQTGWNLWLFGHQLEHGRAPWRDPYSFQPEVSPRVVFQGLVFGLPYWPLSALLGAVLAWNVFTLLALGGAGAATCAWLRALGLPRGAALAGGLAFALAPYRVEQSTGHLLGPISLFLPLALLGIEVRRPLLAGAALAAIPLSGQVHLALGAVPLFIAYAFVRGRGWRDALPGTLAAIVAGELVQHFVIRGSLHESGRSLAEVGKYSAHWSNFVSRHGAGETFVLLGWLTPLLALVGLILLLRERRFALAAFLGTAALIPIALALGTNLPTYELLRRVVPHLNVSRVPERFMPIACLALAALLAFAVARARPWLIAVVLLFVAADLHANVFGAAQADQGNRAYAALRSQPPGRLLELPAFLPDVQFNSTYLYYDMEGRREHPTGYSTTAPAAADQTVRLLQPLTCGNWNESFVTQLGVRYIAVHAAFYRALRPPACAIAALAGLQSHGFRPLATDGDVTIFRGPS
jgi:hypothetical protein